MFHSHARGMGNPPVMIVMGVAGSGKSTIGARLAARLGAEFYDADDFHPAANIAKMAAGIPLDDEDREPWLERLKKELIDATGPGKQAVVACSALKKVYRERLGVGDGGVRLIYLRGDADLLAERLANRAGHFMKPGMLESQLAALEEPSASEGMTVNIEVGVEEILGMILNSNGDIGN